MHFGQAQMPNSVQQNTHTNQASHVCTAPKVPRATQKHQLAHKKIATWFRPAFWGPPKTDANRCVAPNAYDMHTPRPPVCLPARHFSTPSQRAQTCSIKHPHALCTSCLPVYGSKLFGLSPRSAAPPRIVVDCQNRTNIDLATYRLVCDNRYRGALTTPLFFFF